MSQLSVKRLNASVILGAGFSFVAGLPLTRDLFDPVSSKPQAQTKVSDEKYENVRWAFKQAVSQEPALSSEEWLARLYSERANVLQPMLSGTTWHDAIRYVLARLITLPKGSNAHYYYGIGTSQCYSTHQAFWKKVESEFSLKYIVTLNYDILVEQCLSQASSSSHRSAPRCRYGGFQHVQTVRKMTNVTTGAHDLMRLGDEFVLYKLHGSVNWAWEPHSPSLKIHHDVRAVFRADNKYGIPAIVPPIPEKEMPPEFSQIWNEARKVLLETPVWIICGYSLPDYDLALRKWFADILNERTTTTLILLDPNSKLLAKKWQALGKQNLVLARSGLPETLNETWLS